jgi:hypothetical protein
MVSLGLFLNFNLDIYKSLGISIDGGVWGTLVDEAKGIYKETTKWGFSAGVYYKFSFARIKK